MSGAVDRERWQKRVLALDTQKNKKTHMINSHFVIWLSPEYCSDGITQSHSFNRDSWSYRAPEYNEIKNSVFRSVRQLIYEHKQKPLFLFSIC